MEDKVSLPKKEKANRNTLVIRNYPCLINNFLLFTFVVIAILLRKWGFLFGFFVVCSCHYLFKIKHYTYSEISELIRETGDFKKLNLSTSNILPTAVRFAYDGSVKAPIGSFKLYESKAKKLLSVAGILISPLTFSGILLYSILELFVLYAIAKKKKFVVLFSKEIYWKLTRTIIVSSKKLKSQGSYVYEWCGIPGVILIPEQFLDIIVTSSSD